MIRPFSGMGEGLRYLDQRIRDTRFELDLDVISTISITMKPEPGCGVDVSYTEVTGESRLPPPMPLLPISSEETVRKCDSALELRSSDVFICSYPKSGTTWTQSIILSLLFCDLTNSQDGCDAPPYNHVSEYAPFYEIDAHWQGEELASNLVRNHNRIGRRIFNTHLRCDMLPNRGKGGKFIYLVRSPLDVSVSFYHHLSNQVEGNYDKPFEQFFQQWLNGKIPFGSWIDHVLSYMSPFTKGNGPQMELDDGRQFLLITFDQLLNHLPLVLDKLVGFLDLNVSSKELDELLPTYSFSHMKANLDRFQPKSVSWKNNFCFLRRGVSGDGLSAMSGEQLTLFRAWIATSGFDALLTKQVAPTNPDIYNMIIELVNV